MTYARLQLAKSPDGPWKAVRLLVDTGAFYSMVPRRILTRLGIEPRTRRSLKVADGRVVRRELGIAHVRYRGEVSATTVVFGEAEDAAVLGVLTLEALALEIDPATGQIRAMKVIPMIPVAPTA